MKLVALLMLVASVAKADPYFIGLYGSNVTNVQASLGAVFDKSGTVKSSAFTNVAVLYHEASATNSIIPARLQAYIPPESWTLLNVGYGTGVAGIGSSVNLAVTAQSYLSRAALSFNNQSIHAFGNLVAPQPTGLSVNAGPQWFSTIVREGTILPFNQWKGIPGWFAGAAYTKKFN